MTTADLAETAATEAEVWVAVVAVGVIVLAVVVLVALGVGAVWALERMHRNRRCNDDNRGRWPS